jgi:hypothetical protein
MRMRVAEAVTAARYTYAATELPSVVGVVEVGSRRAAEVETAAVHTISRA